MAARVGLTGGIGSGKSLVAGCFQTLGVTVLDADRIAHRLSEPGTGEFTRIVETFGREVLQADGTLDRSRLGAIVFASGERRKELESILHPAIREEMRQQARNDPGCYCLLDIPLLIESGQHREMDRVLVVSCSRETRISRLQQNRGMDRETIERIMASQASDAQRMQWADDLIDNNGDRAAVEAQVKHLHHAYLEQFCP